MAPGDDESIDVLRASVVVLEDEIAELRRKLGDAPAERTRALEERLLQTKGQLAHAVSQNEKLSYTLREAREHIATLRDEVDKLSQPPSAYGVVVGKNDDGTIDVLTSGRKMRVLDCTPRSTTTTSNVVPKWCSTTASTWSRPDRRRSPERSSRLKDLMDDGVRAVVVGRADEERVRLRRQPPRCAPAQRRHTMRLDVRSNLLLEKLPRPEVEDLLLEEVPDISYADIGGLDDQIEQIADAVESAVPVRRTVRRTPAACAEGHPALRTAEDAARP